VTQPDVDTYLYSLLPPRDEVLSEMEAEATRNKIPIVGPVVASFFQQLVMMTGAKTVFEMGSAIGYISHVAIYLGNGWMIQAPQPGMNVEIVPARFGSQFAGAVRVYPRAAAGLAPGLA